MRVLPYAIFCRYSSSISSAYLVPFIAPNDPHIGLPIDNLGVSCNNPLTAAFPICWQLGSQGQPCSPHVVKSKLQPARNPMLCATADMRGRPYTSATSICSSKIVPNRLVQLFSICTALPLSLPPSNFCNGRLYMVHPFLHMLVRHGLQIVQSHCISMRL